MKDYEKVIEIFKSSLKNFMKLDRCEENLDVNTDVCEVNEEMINEHKARRDTFGRNIDIEKIKRILLDKKTIFKKNWQEKYDILHI